MAEFPIFEGTGQGAEATVRTSRIGPEPPRPEGLEKAAAAADEVGSILERHNQARQQVLLQTGHGQTLTDVANYQNAQEGTGYNEHYKEDFHAAVAQSQDKVTKWLAASGASDATIKRYMAESAITTANKLPEIGLQQLRLRNEEHLGMVEANTHAIIQRTLSEGPDDVTADLGRMHKLYDDAVKGHFMTPAEAQTKLVGAMSTMAEAHIDYDISTNPAAALQLLKDPAKLAANPIYSWLNPTKYLGYQEKALNIQHQNAAHADAVWQGWKADAWKVATDNFAAGTPNQEQLAEGFRRGFWTKGQLYALGGPIEGPGNPTAHSAVMGMLKSANSVSEIDGAAAAQAAIPDGNGKELREFKAEEARQRDMIKNQQTLQKKQLNDDVDRRAFNLLNGLVHFGAGTSHKEYMDMLNNTPEGMDLQGILRQMHNDVDVIDYDRPDWKVQAAKIYDRYTPQIQENLKAGQNSGSYRVNKIPDKASNMMVMPLPGVEINATAGAEPAGPPTPGEPPTAEPKAKKKPGEPEGTKAEESTSSEGEGDTAPAVTLDPSTAPAGVRGWRSRMDAAGSK